MEDKLEIDYEVDNVLETFESRIPLLSLVTAVTKILTSDCESGKVGSHQRVLFEMMARVLDCKPNSEDEAEPDWSKLIENVAVVYFVLDL